jgi:hypothetical protein
MSSPATIAVLCYQLGQNGSGTRPRSMTALVGIGRQTVRRLFLKGNAVTRSTQMSNSIADRGPSRRSGLFSRRGADPSSPGLERYIETTRRFARNPTTMARLASSTHARAAGTLSSMPSRRRRSTPAPSSGKRLFHSLALLSAVLNPARGGLTSTRPNVFHQRAQPAASTCRRPSSKASLIICRRPRSASTSSMWSLMQARPWTRCGT